MNGKIKGIKAFRLCLVIYFLFVCCFSSACLGVSNAVKVVLNSYELTLPVGQAFVLIGEASDGDSLSWEINKDGIAEVDGGRIFALSEGTAYVTAYCAHAQALCKLTVVPADPYLPPVGGGEENPETPENPDGDEECYELVWSDEFDGSELDRTKWNYQTGIQDVYGSSYGPKYWGNEEKQYYTEDAVSVSDGCLAITATKEARGDMQYTSGRILTRDLASFKYGYIEAKIKLPAITGMWPAFWMLPQPMNSSSTNNVYGGWAANGEIDIMEVRGREPYITTSALHFGGSWPTNTYKSSATTFATSVEEWHVYAIEWREDGIKWYADGVKFFELSSSEWWTSSSGASGAPFDQPFYILLNLAVGGTFDGNRNPPDNFTSASMYVDYVRVYK